MADEADEDPAAAAAAQAAAAASAATAFEKPQGGGTGSLIASQLAAQLAPWREGGGGAGPSLDAPLRITRNPDLRGPAPMFVRPPAAARTSSEGGAAAATSRSGGQSGRTAAGSRGTDAQQAPDRRRQAQKPGQNASSAAVAGRQEPSSLPSGHSETAAGRLATSKEVGASIGQVSATRAAHGDAEQPSRRAADRPHHRQRGGGSSASASPAVSRTGSPAPTHQASETGLLLKPRFWIWPAVNPASHTACGVVKLLSKAWSV